MSHRGTARRRGNAEGILVLNSAMRGGMAAFRARAKPLTRVPKYLHTPETLTRYQEWKAPGALHMRPTELQTMAAARKAKAVREAEAWIARVKARKANP